MNSITSPLGEVMVLPIMLNVRLIGADWAMVPNSSILMPSALSPAVGLVIPMVLLVIVKFDVPLAATPVIVVSSPIEIAIPSVLELPTVVPELHFVLAVWRMLESIVTFEIAFPACHRSRPHHPRQ